LDDTSGKNDSLLKGTIEKLEGRRSDFSVVGCFGLRSAQQNAFSREHGDATENNID
jgi:hypothetical protein